jgi:hypothetical protein
LLNAYEDVLKFCKDARTVFINDDGSTKGEQNHFSLQLRLMVSLNFGLLPEWTTTRSFFKTQWQPFEARFGEIEKSFEHHLKVLLQSIQPVQLKGIQEVQLSLKSCMYSLIPLSRIYEAY